MARSARIKSEFGIFHITQHGGTCRDLFLSDTDRQKLVDILTRSQQKFLFRLHGYCVLEDNSYDLIIGVNGGDLSKIMKSINIAYAMYAKCNGKLFSDRYKSHPIDSESELDALKKTIVHEGKSNDRTSIFNVCFDFNNLDDNNKSVSRLDFTDCDGCITCLENAQKKLQDFTECEGICLDELNKDKELRNQLIKTFRQHSTLSLKSIGKLFGNLSESTVSKIVNS